MPITAKAVSRECRLNVQIQPQDIPKSWLVLPDTVVASYKLLYQLMTISKCLKLVICLMPGEGYSVAGNMIQDSVEKSYISCVIHVTDS